MDLVLKGVASGALLDTYEGERKADVRAYVEGSDSLGAMIFTRDPVAAAERDKRLISGRAVHQTEQRAINSGILYRSDDQPPRRPVGYLGPQGVVRSSDGEGRFDEIVGSGFQLIGWQVDPAEFLTTGQLEFLHSIGAVICGVTDEEAEEKFVIDVDGNYKDFCSNFGISGMIQRPDFVIFGVIGNPDEYSVLVDDLRRQLTQNGSSC
jgi:3-(3-hydroxy-phenyl)propionate hydroxylase